MNFLNKYRIQDPMLQSLQDMPVDSLNPQPFVDRLLNPMQEETPVPWADLLKYQTEGAEVPVIPQVQPPKKSTEQKMQDTKKVETLPIEEAISAEVPKTDLPVDMGDKEMASALADQREQLRALAIARGMAKIGRAAAGVQDKETPFAEAEQLANLPVAQLEKQREAQYKKFTREQEMTKVKEATDPNSTHSVSYRNLAKSMLDMQGLQNISKAIEGMSADQIDKKFPMISNIVTAKMAQDARREQAALLRAGKEESKLGKEELRHQDWLTNQLEKETKSPETKRIERLASDATNIDRALQNPGGIGEIAVLYGFLKSIDENSAVREGEVKLGLEAMNALERVKAFSSNFTNKKRVLSTQMMKDIKTINDSAKAAASDAYNRRMQKVYNQGLDRGIPKERLDRSLGLLTSESGFGQEPTAPKTMQDSKISDYAKSNNLTYDKAKQILMKRGYTPNEQ